ncbi:DUF3575 domain-containing protein [Bacteroides faecis]|uniref:DUF3575 domain-containing protein n=1 Tax=Bacteroides faecis TaxID=674529 RepID=UPI001D063FFE|nr:DUF3575 domain-containing protein [Bacteroides faecis]MCB6633979.1 DUF3575 domain-containing protein [Bacteroides faecis]MCE8939944.1 DUF3575 domain-containing protein [Bacteroides faecis]
MKYGIYILAIFMAFSASLKSGYAMVSSFTVTQDTTRQVVVYFDREDTTVDFSYKNNNQYINVLDSLLGNKENIRYITAVNVITFVSPDGDSVYNTVLSARRNNSVREFLQQRYPAVDMKKIQLFSGGEDWFEFRKVVEEDSDFPEREEVMMLMDYHRNDIGKRKQLLRKLNKGMAYQYMLRNVLPQLRRSVITIVREIPEIDRESFEPVSSASGLFVSEQEEALPNHRPDKPVGESKKKQVYEVTISEAGGPAKNETILAVKNNLLYDLALAPNIEVEIPMGRRWSLNTEYKCPWWLNSKHNFCYQLLSGGVEGRCWLGDRRKHKRLTGHFVGLYAEGGIYDFQLQSDGYQGKYYGAAGVVYGYARQLARHFSIEFSLGIGYLTTEYKKYTPYEGDIIWANSGRYNFIGPTKAKVSLVWLITKRRR